VSKIVFIGDSITKGIGYGSVTVTDAFAHKVGIACSPLEYDPTKGGGASDL